MYDDKILKSLLLKFRDSEDYKTYYEINHEVRIRAEAFLRRLLNRYCIIINETQHQDIIDDSINYFWEKEYGSNPINKSYSHFIFKRIQQNLFGNKARKSDITIEIDYDIPDYQDIDYDIAIIQVIDTMIAALKTELHTMSGQVAVQELQRLISVLSSDYGRKIKLDRNNAIHNIIIEALYEDS
jgi:hypothetical protein